MNFIKASEVEKIQNFKQANVDKFLTKANKLIAKGETSINDGLDDVPTLSDLELIEVKKVVKESGWNIKVYDDNYQTTSYKFIAIPNFDFSKETIKFK